MASQTTQVRQWTVLELITWSTNHLQEKNIDEPRLTVELMLAHALSMKRIQLYMNFDKPLKPEELAAFKSLFKRRLEREPVQYILGETEFMGFTFAVDRRVLIPRPETEVLVEETVRLCKELRGADASVSVLDVGTGSGCIAVSCAKLIPGAAVSALDSSEGALDAARANAERNGVTIAFAHADIFNDDLFCPGAGHDGVHGPDAAPAVKNFFAPESYDVIVSNPPYISSDVYPTLQPEITEFEPRCAETDEGDGLSFYRRLAAIAKTLLAKDGFLAVEHAYNQQNAVMDIFKLAGWQTLIPIKDYSGNPRCVIARNFS